jgi:hypothetical protein
MSWAQLLKCVFAIGITTCPQCGEPLSILAAIEDPAVIAKILSHLRLPTRAPPQAAARLAKFLQTASSPPPDSGSVAGVDTPSFAHFPNPHPIMKRHASPIQEK